MLKTFGYVVSAVSVLLLGLVTWQSVANNSLMRICLILGMILAGVGMFLRWLSYREDEEAQAGEPKHPFKRKGMSTASTSH